MGQSTSEMIEEELLDITLLSRQWTRKSEMLYNESAQLVLEAKYHLRQHRVHQATTRLQDGARKEAEAKGWAQRASQLAQVKEKVLLSHMSHSFAKSAVRLTRVLKTLDTHKIDQELALFSEELDRLGQAGESLLDEQETPLDVSERLKELQEEIFIENELPYPPIFNSKGPVEGEGIHN